MWNWMKRLWVRTKRRVSNAVSALLGSLFVLLPSAGIILVGYRIFSCDEIDLIMAWAWALLITCGSVLLLVVAFAIGYALIEHTNSPKSQTFEA